jgi:tetratricopeptide (TPR) repeat protein
MVRFFIFFFPLFLLSQQKITQQGIDLKLKKAETLICKGETDAYIRLSLSILEDSKSVDYPRGKAVAYYNLATGYNLKDSYNKSNQYLKLMESELKNTHEDDQEIAMNILYSNNYYGIKMYDEALKKLRKNLILVKNVKIDSNRSYIKSLTLISMGKNYYKKGRHDSATYYDKKAIEELKTQKKLNSIFGTNLKITLLNLAEVKFSENKIDSTELYLKSAQAMPVRLGNREYQTFKISGQIHDVRKEYDLAIADYQKAIELAGKSKAVKNMLELYNLISQTYEKAGRMDARDEYLSKYNILNDSLKIVESENLETTVGLLIEEKQKILKSRNNFLWFGILIGIVFVIGSFLFILFRIRKKNEILEIKEKESKVLNQRLNLAFEEIIQLAKNNDSEFYTRFEEVYPTFFPKLLRIEPELQRSELKFCALLFLNFSTKDIAAYTFVQPQSVQTRKNRMRKRLNIPSDQDIYTWMKSIAEK